MRALVVAAESQPVVIEAARRIVAACPARDTLAEALAIRAWLARRLRFVRDPRGVELLASPAYHIEHIERDGYVLGDCDDAATLGAALAQAVGIPAEFQAVAFNAPAAPLVHVFTVLDVPRGPVELDVTRPTHVRPRVSRRLTLSV